MLLAQLGAETGYEHAQQYGHGASLSAHRKEMPVKVDRATVKD
jgi:hypothetical protein